MVVCFLTYCSLLHRQDCFSGKYTTRKVHTKLHPGLEWRIFHILTSEDIDDVVYSYDNKSQRVQNFIKCFICTRSAKLEPCAVLLASL